MTRARTFNLADLFEIVASCVPERLAFRCGPQQLSYRELDRRATQLASALHGRGIRRGDNVGIQLYNSAAYLETFFACCKIGAAPVNVNYRYVADELSYLFGTLELRALVYGEEFEAEVAAAVPVSYTHLDVYKRQGTISSNVCPDRRAASVSPSHSATASWCPYLSACTIRSTGKS